MFCFCDILCEKKRNNQKYHRRIMVCIWRIRKETVTISVAQLILKITLEYKRYHEKFTETPHLVRNKCVNDSMSIQCVATDTAKSPLFRWPFFLLELPPWCLFWRKLGNSILSQLVTHAIHLSWTNRSVPSTFQVFTEVHQITSPLTENRQLSAICRLARWQKNIQITTNPASPCGGDSVQIKRANGAGLDAKASW